MNINNFEHIAYSNWFPGDLIQFAPEEDPIVPAPTPDTPE
ncbi:MAG: hypothetical protein UW10_C0016G0026 [Candidatus Magasanikbacteria bacterium GW2011_GWA2_43_9]|nr:MAG: hypothetical protein UW10_C0016G0026 [Candidatus Magasanikbacteria bacterium GW2011_GWA2_43_9]